MCRAHGIYNRVELGQEGEITAVCSELPLFEFCLDATAVGTFLGIAPEYHRPARRATRSKLNDKAV